MQHWKSVNFDKGLGRLLMFCHPFSFDKIQCGFVFNPVTRSATASTMLEYGNDVGVLAEAARTRIYASIRRAFQHPASFLLDQKQLAMRFGGISNLS